MKPPSNGMVAKGFVDKDVDGYCIHFDREKFMCAIWNMRPKICSAYNCNNDFLLQVAIRKSFTNQVDLVNLAGTMNQADEELILVPYTDEATTP